MRFSEGQTVVGQYEIVDPRPIAASAKYTYFLPSAERLNAVGVGDLAQITVRSIPPSSKWDAERLWLRVVSSNQVWIEGTLESKPDDMPLLPQGSVVRAPRTHIISVAFESEEKERAFKREQRREYWERCLVDQAVLDGDLAVHYIYREAPELTRKDDKFPDSGWRIRGDMRDVSEQELAERKVAYVAIGAVLNRDDSWVQFLDEPPGSAFEKDFERGAFLPAS